jgi:hypothetical protein
VKVNWERNTPTNGDLRLVRPYALTGGRTRATTGDLPIEAMVVSTEQGLAAIDLRHEARDIVALCHEALSLAEVSARLGVPLGVARVLVGDLLGAGHVEVRRTTADNSRPDVVLLTRVLEGLEAL